jgi:hypothetical protein
MLGSVEYTNIEPKRGANVMSSRAQAIVSRSVALVGGTTLLLGLVAAPAWATKTPKSHLATYAPSDTFTTASLGASVTLPAFTCKSTQDGIDIQDALYNSDSDQWSSANVGLQCIKEKVGKHRRMVAHFAASLDLQGVFSNPSTTMNAGDTVVLSASCVGLSIVVSVDDTTTHSSASANSADPCTSDDAGIGLNGIVKLPTFGAVSFADVTVDGLPIAITDPVASNYYEGRKYVITTGPLTDDGTAFTATQGS